MEVHSFSLAITGRQVTWRFCENTDSDSAGLGSAWGSALPGAPDQHLGGDGGDGRVVTEWPSAVS